MKSTTQTTIVPSQPGFFWIEVIVNDDCSFEILQRPIVAFQIEAEGYGSIAMPVMIWYDGSTPKNVRAGGILNPNGTVTDEYGGYYHMLYDYCLDSVEVIKRRAALATKI